MSVLTPEFEFVDGTDDSIRYLEHGWPTDLCRWHSHEELELHLITETRGKTFVGDYIGEFVPGSLFLVGPHLPHNWITDEFVALPYSHMVIQIVCIFEFKLNWSGGTNDDVGVRLCLCIAA